MRKRTPNEIFHIEFQTKISTTTQGSTPTGQRRKKKWSAINTKKDKKPIINIHAEKEAPWWPHGSHEKSADQKD
jgi:hypothetical protein